MRILIACDSFKDCLSAKEVGEYLRKGILKASEGFDVRIVPMADGGEGTVEALLEASGGSKVSCTVNNPLNQPIKASYGISGDGTLAIIEMAAASGIELLTKEERNPWVTTTFGTGQLIADALDKGCKRFICGIGGSATNDGGVGMLMALGVQFFDKQGNTISMGGGGLEKLESIDLSKIDPRLETCQFTIACDVTNPLTGTKGASAIYGPQKGADTAMVLRLDNALTNYARLIDKELGVDVDKIPGSGAAGGLGAAFAAFLRARLTPGIEIVVEENNLAKHCHWADFVITGEGKLDEQTRFGKTPKGVADVAARYNVPVIAVAGTLGANYNELYKYGFDSIFSIIDKPMELDQALAIAPELIMNTGESIARMLLMGK